MAKISPKRNPIKSTLTQLIKASTTKPTASAECANKPSNVSDERVARRCNNNKEKATKTETKKTTKVIENNATRDKSKDK